MKKFSLQLLFALLLSACAKNTDDVCCLPGQEAENATHTIIMNFEGNVPQFEQTRATTSFANGTMMYIYFTNSGGSTIYGTAVYNFSIRNWEMTYTGNLNNQTNSTCTLYYFVNPVSANSTSASLNTSSISYKGTGTFTKTATSLNVTCTLNPNCSRIRFKGTSGKVIKITGFGYFSSLSMSSTSLSTASVKPTYEISSTVEPSGYTPYIYYNDCAENITITTDGATYSMQIPSGMKSYNGKSGYLTIPTSGSHSGWTTTGGSDTGSHEYVDLGLSVKWATCNVGADKPEDYGNYYAWGETSAYGEDPSAYPSGFTGIKNSGYTSLSTKTYYDWSTYKYCRGSESTMTKYCNSSSYGTVDNKTVLEPEDDAAHVNWGGSWRMPTKEEQVELQTKCTWTWTSQNGVNGYKVTSKTNGNSLFLPAAGRRYSSGLGSVGGWGYYWSSSLYSDYSYYACYLYFNSSSVNSYDYLRYLGFAVRPVCQ